MAVETLTNKEIRNQLEDYGILAAYNSIAAWKQILREANNAAEAKELARRYLPEVILSMSDNVGEYALINYLYERSLSDIAETVPFTPQNNSIAGKTMRTVNTLTAWDIDDALDSLEDLDWAKFEKELAEESRQLMYDKYKSLMEENGAADSLVTYLKLYVRSDACAWCCMIASGSGGKRRVRRVNQKGTFTAGAETGLEDAIDSKSKNARVAVNKAKYATNGFFAQETEAHLHLHCHCVYRPVFENGVEYDDEASNKRISLFEEEYAAAVKNGESSMDIKGNDSLLTQVRAATNMR